MAEVKKKTAVKVEKEIKDGTTEESNQTAPEASREEQEVTAEEEAKVTKAGKRSAKAIKEAEEAQAKEERKAAAAETEETKPPVQQHVRTRLERAGKKFREAAKLIEKDKAYTLAEAADLAVKTSPTKFDATVELHINLGVDPRQADQNIRGMIQLPEGTGREVRVAVADEDLLKKLDKGIIEFDVLVATPDFMPKLGKYARVLGPKGLMPNPKSGTVTTDVEKAVKEAGGGRVEYRVDSTGIVHLGVGKVSFGADRLVTNMQAVFASIKAAKPGSIKGNYVKNITVSSTMGPGIKVLTSEL